jgi:hypothetical protein
MPDALAAARKEGHFSDGVMPNMLASCGGQQHAIALDLGERILGCFPSTAPQERRCGSGRPMDGSAKNHERFIFSKRQIERHLYECTVCGHQTLQHRILNQNLHCSHFFHTILMVQCRFAFSQTAQLSV